MLLSGVAHTFVLLCLFSGAAGEEIEVPAHQIHKLHGQKPDNGAKQRGLRPTGQVVLRVDAIEHEQSDDRQQAEQYDGAQLFGCGGRSAPMPTKSIPPENGCDFPAELVGWIQKSSAT